MDNLIDFNSSPISFTKDINSVDGMLCRSEYCNSFDVLQDGDFFDKKKETLNDPFEYQSIKKFQQRNTESTCLSQTSYLTNAEDLLIDFEDKQAVTRKCSKNTSHISLNADQNIFRGKQGKTEMKNGLLKLSISNALIQSPVSGQNLTGKEMTAELSILNEAAKLAKQLSQTHLSSPSSSPKKSWDDSCEDLMLISPNWVDSESDISKDLEMLKIPMLDKIPENFNQDFVIQDKEIKISDSEISSEKIGSEMLIDINALKEKVKCKQNQAFKPADDVDLLISNLKEYVIKNCEADYLKKSEAQKLLNSLSHVLKNENVSETTIATPEIPKPIVRQGTFNLDTECTGIKNLKSHVLKNENASETTTPKIPKLKVRQESFNIDTECAEVKNFKGHSQIETERANINLQSQSPTEIDNMVEQIGKILGRTENVNFLETKLQNSIVNPTVIVVMSTQGKNTSKNNTNYDQVLTSPFQKEYRRRSYSLSDKKNLRIDNSANVSQSKIMNPAKDCNSFKTPRRSFINRRNSISSSNPNSNGSFILKHRRSICGNTNSNIKYENKSQINTTESLQKSQETKSMFCLKTDINSKQFRLKSKENVRSKGPVKATLEINNLKPFIRKPVQTPNIEKNVKELDSHYFSFSSEDCNVKNTPIACSTPMLSSPTKSPVNKKNNRLRLSVTPNVKTQSKSLNASDNFLINRRKSFSDSTTMKVKQKTVTNNASQTTKISQEPSKLINRLKLSTPFRRTTVSKENKDPKN